VLTHLEIRAALDVHLAKRDAVTRAATQMGAQRVDGTTPITDQDTAAMDVAQTALIAWQAEESRLRRALEAAEADRD
jgi:hypothetical protein